MTPETMINDETPQTETDVEKDTTFNSIGIVNLNTTTKSKKLPQKSVKKKSVANKKDLWNIYDTEIEPDRQNIKDKPVSKLECLFGSIGNREICERCESLLSYSDEGFLTCSNNKCGIVYRDLIDQSAEWRYYGADDNQHSDPTRCGMPINPLLEESSYGCRVLTCGGMSYEMRKIRRYAEWQAMPYKEKSQYDDFQLITAMANNAGIPKMIIDDAILYRKRISESNTTFRGDNRDGVIAASIYIACRINNYPRTAKEIATIFHLDHTSATKGCKNALSIINELEKDMNGDEKTNLGRTKPEAFIERYCSKLNINNELTKLCQFISMKIEKLNVMAENTPPSIAAGIVYYIAFVCGLNISKKDVKNVSETSEVTINKCFKKLERITQEHNLIPASIAKKYIHKT